jgi:hypothetical protein
VVCLAANAAAGGTTDSGGSAAGAKTGIVLMIETASSPLNKEKIIPKLREKFPDINFISRPKDDSRIEKAVKTTFKCRENPIIYLFYLNDRAILNKRDIPQGGYYGKKKRNGCPGGHG